MKANVIETYGAPDVIVYTDVNVPQICDDEVLIKVAATSFNPADAAIRSGAFQTMFPLKFPYTLGLDVSGVIEKIGSSINQFKIGDRVFGCLDFITNGAAAEYVACKASLVTNAPKTIPLVEAAALPGVGYTAWQALFTHANLQQGQRLLITAAAGGVGTIAVQLAKWKGAYVIGTASERSFTILNSLNIDEIIDYNSKDFLEGQIEPVDAILNLSPAKTIEINKMLNLLKPNGILVSTANPADNSIAESLGVRTLRIAMTRTVEQLTAISKLVDEKIIHPVITNRYQLKDLVDAHKKSGQTNGKTIIVVDETL